MRTKKFIFIAGTMLLAFLAYGFLCVGARNEAQEYGWMAVFKFAQEHPEVGIELSREETDAAKAWSDTVHGPFLMAPFHYLRFKTAYEGMNSASSSSDD